MDAGTELRASETPLSATQRVDLMTSKLLPRMQRLVQQRVNMWLYLHKYCWPHYCVLYVLCNYLCIGGGLLPSVSVCLVIFPKKGHLPARKSSQQGERYRGGANRLSGLVFRARCNTHSTDFPDGGFEICRSRAYDWKLEGISSFPYYCRFPLLLARAI